jgi:hypothetical protein
LIIPQKITLAGMPITTVFLKGTIEKYGGIAAADYGKQQIVVEDGGNVLAPEAIQQAYIHEALHWLFYIMGKEDMRNDEALVDAMAHLVLQAINQAEFEE